MATVGILTFSDGRGALLPAFQDFLAALTFEAGHLVDVAYEPSDWSPRWHDFQARADEIRSLRAAVAPVGVATLAEWASKIMAANSDPLS